MRRTTISILFFVALFCGVESITIAQQSAKSTANTADTGYEKPVYDNTAASIDVTIGGRSESIHAYSDHPIVAVDQQEQARFFYSKFPSIAASITEKDANGRETAKIYNPKTKRVSFAVKLLTLDAISPDTEAKLRNAIKSELGVKRNDFPLIPAPITGYSIRLKAGENAETLTQEIENVRSAQLLIDGTVKNVAIQQALETNPASVNVHITLFSPFRVLKITAIKSVVETHLLDKAIESVLGTRPKNEKDIFVSRNVHQKITRSIKSGIEVLFPADMSKELSGKWDNFIAKFEKEFKPIKTEDLSKLSTENIFYLAEQYRTEIEPTVIRNIISSSDLSGTYKKLLNTTWDFLYDAAKAETSDEKFHNAVYDKGKQQGTTGGNFNLLDILKVGGSSSANFDKDYSKLSDSEKKATRDFREMVKTNSEYKENVLNSFTQKLIGEQRYDQVDSKALELSRVSVSELTQSITLLLGEVQEFNVVNIPQVYHYLLKIELVDPGVEEYLKNLRQWQTQRDKIVAEKTGLEKKLSEEQGKRILQLSQERKTLTVRGKVSAGSKLTIFGPYRYDEKILTNNIPSGWEVTRNQWFEEDRDNGTTDNARIYPIEYPNNRSVKIRVKGGDFWGVPRETKYCELSGRLETEIKRTQASIKEAIASEFRTKEQAIAKEKIKLEVLDALKPQPPQ
jgi:hypothetical protein